jgi:hypothetical protein
MFDDAPDELARILAEMNSPAEQARTARMLAEACSPEAIEANARILREACSPEAQAQLAAQLAEAIMSDDELAQMFASLREPFAPFAPLDAPELPAASPFPSCANCHGPVIGARRGTLYCSRRCQVAAFRAATRGN